MVFILVGDDAGSPRSSDSDSDLENLHEENKKHRPYRDRESKKESDYVSKTTDARKNKNYTRTDIKERVKKSLSKTQKQNHRRTVKKGEASLTTHKQNEQRSIIKDSW